MNQKRVLMFFILSLIILVAILGVVSALSTTTTLLQRGSGIFVDSTTEHFTGDNSVGLSAPLIKDLTNEGTIKITFNSLTTLNDIQNISWMQKVTQGYISHVDVLLDLNDNGVYNGVSGGDDALVFEYDKVQHPSDQLVSEMNYQTNTWVNTFDNKGIVDDNARSWLTSGDAGCGNDAYDCLGFIDGTLEQWKTGTADDTSINGNIKVLALEIEVDGWIAESEAYVDDIRINGEIVEYFDDVAPEITNIYWKPNYPSCDEESKTVYVYSTITDESGIMDYPELKWRIVGNEEYSSPSMTLIGGNEYYAGITAPKEDGLAIEYKIVAYDNNGNKAESSYDFQPLFTYDCSPPETSDGIPIAWTNQNVEVTLICIDSITDCNKTYYSIDGSEPSILYGLPFLITENTQLKYYSIDKSRNVEEVKTKYVQIDKIVPETTDDYSNDDIWVNSDQTITLTPSDNGGSGLDWIKYCLIEGCDPSSGTDYTSPVGIITEGVTYFRYASADKAGNIEEVKEKIVKIDKTAPTITNDYTDGWKSDDQTVILTPSDVEDSGIKEVKYCLGESCTPNTPLDDPYEIPFNGDQITILRYQTWDNANNPSVIGRDKIKIDKTKPITTSSFTSEGWQNSGVTIELTCNDPLVNDVASGCYQTSYCIDSDNNCLPNINYNENIIYGEEGAHYIRFASEDVAGNNEIIKSQIIKIDTTFPEIIILSPTVEEAVNVQRCSEAVVVNITDVGVGVNGSSVYAQLINSTTGDVVRNIPLIKTPYGLYEGLMDKSLPIGSYTLEFYASDNLENQGMDFIEEYLNETVFVEYINPASCTINPQIGGTCVFEFNVCIRGGNSVQFWMGRLGDIVTPGMMNATIFTNPDSTYVGLKDISNAGSLLLGEGCKEINGKTKFRLSLDLSPNITSSIGAGRHVLNYTIESSLPDNC